MGIKKSSTRRERRKAKQSGFRREPKGSKVGHGPGDAAIVSQDPKPVRLVKPSKTTGGRGCIKPTTNRPKPKPYRNAIIDLIALIPKE